MMGNSPSAMTLLQFTTAIGNAVRMSPMLHGAWVIAELSDLRVSGGHCYMELIEKSASGQTVAKMRATIWQNSFHYIRQKFFANTGRDIVNGMKVMLYGSASHHTLYGLSYSVTDVDPSYTLGDMERLRREILMRLDREGVIGVNKSRHMCLAPQRIAVISAEGAAGYGDFMKHLEGNAERFVFYPVLIPAVMQGEHTSESVRKALEFIEMTIDLWDCVAIVRGGGATTDLNGFDDYELARAVATFPLPIVVGIGHERDRTVLDEIAHTRLKTPTAVAAFFVDTLRESYNKVGGMVDYIIRYCNDRITGEFRRLSNVEALVPALADSRLSAARAILGKCMSSLPVIVQGRVSKEKIRIESYENLINVMASQCMSSSSEKLKIISERLKTGIDYVIKHANENLSRLDAMVNVLSPSNTLRRGYSITRVGGKAVTDSSELSSGSRMITQFYIGSVESVVE